MRKPYDKNVTGIFQGNMLENQVFSVGQVSKIFSVAPRTVAKWMDQGFLCGRRLPGSLDRRFDRKDLIKFAKENNINIPLKTNIGDSILVYSVNSNLSNRINDRFSNVCEVGVARNAIEAGVFLSTLNPALFILGFENGDVEFKIAATECKLRFKESCLIVAVVYDDLFAPKYISKDLYDSITNESKCIEYIEKTAFIRENTKN